MDGKGPAYVVGQPRSLRGPAKFANAGNYASMFFPEIGMACTSNMLENDVGIVYRPMETSLNAPDRDIFHVHHLLLPCTY